MEVLEDSFIEKGSKNLVKLIEITSKKLWDPPLRRTTPSFFFSVDSHYRVGTDDTPEQAAPAYESAVEEMRKAEKAVTECAFFGKNDGSISPSFRGLSENLTAGRFLRTGLSTVEPLAEVNFRRDYAKFVDELRNFRQKKKNCLEGIVSSKRPVGVDVAAETIEQIDWDALILHISKLGIDYPFGIDYDVYDDHKKIWEEAIKKSRIAHMGSESGGFVGGNRPGDTCTAESMMQISSEFTLSHTGLELYYDAGIQKRLGPGNALEKVRSKQSRGPNIVCNALGFLKSASKLAVGTVIIGNTPAVGAVRAMTPEAAEPGSLQAEDFEKWSNFWFGVVACVGTLVAIIALCKSFNWRRHHSIARTSAASAPAGAILNRAVNIAQTHTVLRSWRETEFREVVVALREEEGA